MSLASAAFEPQLYKGHRLFRLTTTDDDAGLGFSFSFFLGDFAYHFAFRMAVSFAISVFRPPYNVSIQFILTTLLIRTTFCRGNRSGGGTESTGEAGREAASGHRQWWRSNGWLGTGNGKQILYLWIPEAAYQHTTNECIAVWTFGRTRTKDAYAQPGDLVIALLFRLDSRFDNQLLEGAAVKVSHDELS